MFSKRFGKLELAQCDFDWSPRCLHRAGERYTIHTMGTLRRTAAPRRLVLLAALLVLPAQILAPPAGPTPISVVTGMCTGNAASSEPDVTCSTPGDARHTMVLRTNHARTAGRSRETCCRPACSQITHDTFPSISELCGAGGALVHNASVVPCEASSGCELEDFVQCCSPQALPMPPSRLASWRHQLEWLYGITQAFMAVLMLYLWKKVVWRLLLWSAQS